MNGCAMTVNLYLINTHINIKLKLIKNRINKLNSNKKVQIHIKNSHRINNSFKNLVYVQMKSLMNKFFFSKRIIIWKITIKNKKLMKINKIKAICIKR